MRGALAFVSILHWTYMGTCDFVTMCDMSSSFFLMGHFNWSAVGIQGATTCHCWQSPLLTGVNGLQLWTISSSNRGEQWPVRSLANGCAPALRWYGTPLVSTVLVLLVLFRSSKWVTIYKLFEILPTFFTYLLRMRAPSVIPNLIFKKH